MVSILYFASFVVLSFWMFLTFSVSGFVDSALAYYEANPDVPLLLDLGPDHFVEEDPLEKKN